MSLRDEVAKRVQLNRRGWGRCPFHGPDTTPSFHVFVASKGKHRGEEIFFCQACHAIGDGADWQEFVTGRKGKIPTEDSEVRRVRLADDSVKAERNRLWLAFIKQYPDTPDAAFDFLETVQARLESARLGK